VFQLFLKIIPNTKAKNTFFSQWNKSMAVFIDIVKIEPNNVQFGTISVLF